MFSSPAFAYRKPSPQRKLVDIAHDADISSNAVHVGVPKQRHVVHPPKRYLVLVTIDAARVHALVGAVVFADSRGSLEVVTGGAVKLLLKDRIVLIGLPLGLEIVQRLAGAVGASSLIGEGEVVVF